MKNLLIIAVLSCATAIPALFVSFPLSVQHMVGVGLLFVAAASSILAIIRAQVAQQERVDELRETSDRFDQQSRQHHDELQGHLDHIESSFRSDYDTLSSNLHTSNVELNALAREITVSNSSLSKTVVTQSGRLTQLEKSDQKLGVLLAAMSQTFENLRLETEANLQEFTGTTTAQVEVLNVDLRRLISFSETLRDDRQVQEEKMETLQSFVGEMFSFLQGLQEECESQFELQNTGQNSLVSLLSESMTHLGKLQKLSASSFNSQKDKSDLQLEILTRVEQGYSDLDQIVTKLGDGTSASGEAIRKLTKQSSDESEQQRLSCEVLTKLVSENDEHVAGLQTLIEGLKNDHTDGVVTQTEILTALNSTVGSQQDAVVAAMRQVENSHRPQGRLEGDLTNTSLPDLLQILQLAKQTASILLKDIDGSLYIEKGHLVYVRQGKFAGIQAFVRIMMLVRGYFSVRFDILPNSLPKKTRPLLPELLCVIAEVDEIQENLSVLNRKIQKESKLDSFLVQLPSKGIDKAVLQTFDSLAPARLEELVISMGKGVQENVTLLEELYENDQLTLIS